MKVRSKHALLSLFIAAALGGVVVADASAQSSRSSKKAAKAEVMYPEATRQEPGIKASPKAGKKLQKLIDVYNSGEDFAQTRALADDLLATEGANAYDRSLAAQLAAQAAYSLGLTHAQSMRFVILPQAFRRMVPPLVNEGVTLIKDSSLVSAIGLAELALAARTVAGAYSRYWEPYLAISAVYLVLTLTLSLLAKRLEAPAHHH